MSFHNYIPKLRFKLCFYWFLSVITSPVTASIFRHLKTTLNDQKNKRLWEQELYSSNWIRSSIPRLYSKFPSKKRYFSYKTKKATGFGHLWFNLTYSLSPLQPKAQMNIFQYTFLCRSLLFSSNCPFLKTVVLWPYPSFQMDTNVFDWLKIWFCFISGVYRTTWWNEANLYQKVLGWPFQTCVCWLSAHFLTWPWPLHSNTGSNKQAFFMYSFERRLKLKVLQYWQKGLKLTVDGQLQ